MNNTLLYISSLFASLFVFFPNCSHSSEPPRVLRAFEHNEASILRMSENSMAVFFLPHDDQGRSISYIKTDDIGESWSNPIDLLRLPNPPEGYKGHRKPGDWITIRSLSDNDAELHFFLLRLRGKGRDLGINRFLDLWHLRSYQNRTKWSEPQCIFEAYTGAQRSAIQLKNDRIVVPVQMAVPGRDTSHPTGLEVTTSVYSDDGGETWHISPDRLTAPCYPDFNGNNYGACEPRAIELGNGKIWMLMRTQTGRLYQSYSEDGNEWTKADPSIFRSSSSPAALIRLNDGRLMIFWNSCEHTPWYNGKKIYSGRDVLHCAISEDEGKSWKGFREVYRDPKRNENPPKRGDRGTAYPDAAATANGEAMLVTGQGEGRRAILVVNPDWLYESGQFDDFSDGLAKWCVFREDAIYERSAGAKVVQDSIGNNSKALHVYKDTGKCAAAAVRNFPWSTSGNMEMKIMAEKGFAGGSISLVDRFFNPYDRSVENEPVFQVHIVCKPVKKTAIKLEQGRWHKLQMKWSVKKGYCEVSLEDKTLMYVPLLRDRAGGVNYLRIRCFEEPDVNNGMLVESVLFENLNGVIASGLAKEPFFEKISFQAKTNQRNAYPVIASIPDGRILCAWTQDRKIVGRFSEDCGESWSGTQEIINTGEGYADADPSIVVTKDLIQVYSTTIPVPRKPVLSSDIYKSECQFNSDYWTTPVLTHSHHQYLVGMVHAGIRLKDGTLLRPYSWDIPADKGIRFEGEKKMNLKSGVLISQDNGKNWLPSRDIYAEPPRTGTLSTGGVAEPSIVELNSGKLYMLLRTSDTHHWESYSSDGGRTWTEPRRSKITGHNTPSAMVRLKDGRIVLVWNNSPDKRTPLEVAVSDDNAETWSQSKTLSNPKDVQASYPSVCQADDGTIVVVWQQDRPGRKSRDLYIARFAPEWLTH